MIVGNMNKLLANSIYFFDSYFYISDIAYDIVQISMSTRCYILKFIYFAV